MNGARWQAKELWLARRVGKVVVLQERRPRSAAAIEGFIDVHSSWTSECHAVFTALKTHFRVVNKLETLMNDRNRAEEVFTIAPRPICTAQAGSSFELTSSLRHVEIRDDIDLRALILGSDCVVKSLVSVG